MIYIGIDPGVNTGVAIYDAHNKALISVQSMGIIEAMEAIKKYPNSVVYVEDARQRKWFGSSGKEKLQGAGSIKRDCQIWEDFLSVSGNVHYFIAPKNNRTKLSSAQFKALTKYEKQTNEHGRDAATLVFGK